MSALEILLIFIVAGLLCVMVIMKRRAPGAAESPPAIDNASMHGMYTDMYAEFKCRHVGCNLAPDAKVRDSGSATVRRATPRCRNVLRVVVLHRP